RCGRLVRAGHRRGHGEEQERQEPGLTSHEESPGELWSSRANELRCARRVRPGGEPRARIACQLPRAPGLGVEYENLFHAGARRREGEMAPVRRPRGILV